MADKAIYSVDKITNLSNSGNIYINSGSNIKQISQKDLIASMFKNLQLYAQTGKSLGTSYTSAQQAEVSNGTFDGINIGDYWSIGGVTWRVWDIDWYMNKGDSQCTTHHLVIMPDGVLLTPNGSTTHYMNDTDTTAGGYAGTKYRGTYRSECEAKIKECFGDRILAHRELMCTAVSNGAPSGWAWTDATVELPSEIMMYGSTVWGNGTYNVGSMFPQLTLARLNPARVIYRSYSYWLRDVSSASQFAFVRYSGDANYNDASSAWLGVRPFFLLR